MLNYKEQLSDARWLKKKNEVLERDGYVCQKCGKASHLNVHHLNYEQGKLAWEYPNESLITLCNDCHETEHNIPPKPIVGNFYTYDHGDFTNDMLCYHIDYRNEFVYLFGVDNGNHGGGYIDVFSFETFRKKCQHSTFVITTNSDDYTERSFNIAYRKLLHDFAYVDSTHMYNREQLISFAKEKVFNLYNEKTKNR